VREEGEENESSTVRDRFSLHRGIFLCVAEYTSWSILLYHRFLIFNSKIWEKMGSHFYTPVDIRGFFRLMSLPNDLPVPEQDRVHISQLSVEIWSGFSVFSVG